MNIRTVYLDHNASTPCAPEVVDAMLPFFCTTFGNASSPHVMGRRASHAVEHGRLQVARAIGAASEDVFFTSGATESNNMVLRGVAERAETRRRVVFGAAEHKSVLEPCRWLSENGFDVVEIPVTRDGVVDVGAAAEMINGDTLIVSVQGANNETGALQPIRAIADIARSHNALVHCDAAQMLGKVLLAVDDIGVDFASFSGHKVYGPKGVGALYVRRGKARAKMGPILRGGGQESEVRPGTLNVPGVVGFGTACDSLSALLEKEAPRVRGLRDFLEQQILAVIPDVLVIGSAAARLPGTSSLCFLGVPADVLIPRASTLCIGSGSACTSGTYSPSYVVLACGYSHEVARCVVRISVGRYTDKEEVELAVGCLAENVKAIRNQNHLSTSATVAT